MNSRGQKFGGKYRIKHRQDFLRIQENGAKYRSRNLLLVVAPVSQRVGGADGIDTPDGRFGITVTRRLEKRATRRNRLKRRIREYLRRVREHLLAPADIVVIARSGSTELEYRELSRQLSHLLNKAGLLKRSAAPRRPKGPRGPSGPTRPGRVAKS